MKKALYFFFALFIATAVTCAIILMIESSRQDTARKLWCSSHGYNTENIGRRIVCRDSERKLILPN